MDAVRFKQPEGTLEEMREQQKKNWQEAEKAIDEGKPICLSDLIGGAENIHLVSIKE